MSKQEAEKIVPENWAEEIEGMFANLNERGKVHAQKQKEKI